jgi:hypothetical protein
MGCEHLYDIVGASGPRGLRFDLNQEPGRKCQPRLNSFFFFMKFVSSSPLRYMFASIAYVPSVNLSKYECVLTFEI